MAPGERSLTVFLSCVLFASIASPAVAGPKFSCKPDKRLDVPMQFTPDIESAGRVHLSASGGSDKSGWVGPDNKGAWRVFDASGKDITSYTESLLVFSSSDILKQAYVEGLLPGTYTIQLTSMDLCGNRGQTQRSITLEPPALEANPPAISAPQAILVGALGASAYAIHFTATDDTGIKHLWVEVNGNPIKEFEYFNGTAFRWWTGFYPDDSSVTTLEGPGFLVGYPEAYKGQCGVRVTAEDVLGNQQTVTGQFCLP